MRDGERKEKESFTILLAEFLCRSRCEEARVSEQGNNSDF